MPGRKKKNKRPKAKRRASSSVSESTHDDSQDSSPNESTSPLSPPSDNVQVTYADQLPTVTLPRPEPVADSHAALHALEPELAQFPIAHVKDQLLSTSPELYANISRLRFNTPKIGASSALPTEIQVSINGQPTADLPSHIIAVHSDAESSSQSPVTFHPVHPLIIASHCAAIPPFIKPKLEGFSSSEGSGSSTLSVPILRVALPDPSAFPSLLLWIYNRNPRTLLTTILNLQAPLVDPAHIDSYTPTELAAVLADTFSTSALARIAQHVHGVWADACRLGVWEPDLWATLELAGGAVQVAWNAVQSNKSLSSVLPALPYTNRITKMIATGGDESNMIIGGRSPDGDIATVAEIPNYTSMIFEVDPSTPPRIDELELEDDDGYMTSSTTTRNQVMSPPGSPLRNSLGLSLPISPESQTGNSLGLSISIPGSPILSPTSLSIPPPTPTAASILTVSTAVLGYGSQGTIVYKGEFQGRPVAVKRLLKAFVTIASREVSLLQESDHHPNVISYYYQEAREDFFYIALELCPASLYDLIERSSEEHVTDLLPAFDPKKALRQVTHGLRHLHSLHIVHRDIKPQNIMVAMPPAAAKSNGKGRSRSHSKAKDYELRMLISDFGLCKKMEMDESSWRATSDGQGAGTCGWRAPELLRGEVNLDVNAQPDSDEPHPPMANGRGKTPVRRLTKSVDIFSLGCLFFYTLTNGGHPFGDRYAREMNIINNEKNLRKLEGLGDDQLQAADLIERMLNPDSTLRPDTSACLAHPYFWSPSKRLSFLLDASDRLESSNCKPSDKLVKLLEEDSQKIVGTDWTNRLDKMLITNITKFRDYDTGKIQDLLRVIRNKKHHYQSLPQHIKKRLGPLPDGYLSYFTSRYPALLMHIYHVVARGGLDTEEMFQSYFRPDDA
ncbi:kinase-like protein [Sistotremastrum niveocremeum HHB9708]|uniref:non-specific serine/threonine protein kinase n=1 Tax=Sistotremastrum niveocremeum HHB9708 TaxID=1314777 RepID=A0A164YJT9_9AGAM|nr:kinase-like protein [Sistotremastrum niveocremeum HHB9708]